MIMEFLTLAFASDELAPITSVFAPKLRQFWLSVFVDIFGDGP